MVRAQRYCGLVAYSAPGVRDVRDLSLNERAERLAARYAPRLAQASEALVVGGGCLLNAHL
jgi:hypothetical protein